jgi:hypothetical protein
MRPKSTLALAVAAGFVGGLAAHYLVSTPVYAQSPASAQEIRAHEFILVDKTGTPRGVFGIEENGTPMIEMADSNGHVFAPLMQSWGSAGSMFRSLAWPKKPTLLSIKP